MANQLTDSGGNSYVYDGHNRRVKTIDSKGTSYSFYTISGQMLYREVNGNGVNYIHLGKKLIAKYGIIPVSNTNSRQHYRPFGETIEAPKDDVGYTGHKFDTDLGLSYMQQRYMDPVLGRFMNNDPIGFRDVHSFNRYVYANNNPYKYTDPDGMSPKESRLSNLAKLWCKSCKFVGSDIADAIEKGNMAKAQSLLKNHLAKIEGPPLMKQGNPTKRTNRHGDKAGETRVKVTNADGTTKDMTNRRVKETEHTTFKEPGKQQPTKQENPIGGEKNKRATTVIEKEIIKDFEDK